MAHAQKCILEAERFPGPSLVLLLSYCKQHHTDLPVLEYLDESVKSGFWPVYSWDPRRAEEDKHPLEILEDVGYQVLIFLFLTLIMRCVLLFSKWCKSNCLELFFVVGFLLHKFSTSYDINFSPSPPPPEARLWTSWAPLQDPGQVHEASPQLQGKGQPVQPLRAISVLPVWTSYPIFDILHFWPCSHPNCLSWYQTFARDGASLRCSRTRLLSMRLISDP